MSLRTDQIQERIAQAEPDLRELAEQVERGPLLLDRLLEEVAQGLSLFVGVDHLEEPAVEAGHHVGQDVAAHVGLEPVFVFLAVVQPGPVAQAFAAGPSAETEAAVAQ